MRSFYVLPSSRRPSVQTNDPSNRYLGGSSQVSHGPLLTLICCSYVSGVIAKISDNVEIPVTGVATAAVKLGLLGSENIPKEASPAVVNVPSKDGLSVGRFTLVNNPGLLQLAGLKAK